MRARSMPKKTGIASSRFSSATSRKKMKNVVNSVFSSQITGRSCHSAKKLPRDVYLRLEKSSNGMVALCRSLEESWQAQNLESCRSILKSISRNIKDTPNINHQPNRDYFLLCGGDMLLMEIILSSFGKHRRTAGQGVEFRERTSTEHGLSRFHGGRANIDEARMPSASSTSDGNRTLFFLWDQCLEILRELCMSSAFFSENFSVHREFLVCLFGLMEEKSTFNSAALLAEEMLGVREETLSLADVPNFAALVKNLSFNQLAYFCRVLAMVVFEPEDRAPEVSALQKGADPTERAEREADLAVADRNHEVLLDIPEILPRLVHLLEELNEVEEGGEEMETEWEFTDDELGNVEDEDAAVAALSEVTMGILGLGEGRRGERGGARQGAGSEEDEEMRESEDDESGDARAGMEVDGEIEIGDRQEGGRGGGEQLGGSDDSEHDTEGGEDGRATAVGEQRGAGGVGGVGGGGGFWQGLFRWADDGTGGRQTANRNPLWTGLGLFGSRNTQNQATNSTRDQRPVAPLPPQNAHIESAHAPNDSDLGGENGHRAQAAPTERPTTNVSIPNQNVRGDGNGARGRGEGDGIATGGENTARRGNRPNLLPGTRVMVFVGNPPQFLGEVVEEELGQMWNAGHFTMVRAADLDLPEGAALGNVAVAFMNRGDPSAWPLSPMHHVEVLFVLCALCGGKRKEAVQERLVELGLVRLLAKLFDLLDWSAPQPSVPEPHGIHGPGCACNPKSALKIQYLRLVHNFCDRDGPNLTIKHLLAGRLPSTSSAAATTPFHRGQAIRGILGSFSRHERGSLEQGSSQEGGAEGGGMKKEKSGLMVKIIEVLMKEPADSVYRFWLASCVEAFLRGSDPIDQEYVAVTGLMEHLVAEVLDGSSGFKCAASLQIDFDLLGELIKFNPRMFAHLNKILHGSKLTRFIEVLVSNLVDSNVFIRSIVLSLEYFHSGVPTPPYAGCCRSPPPPPSLSPLPSSIPPNPLTPPPSSIALAAVKVHGGTEELPEREEMNGESTSGTSQRDEGAGGRLSGRLPKAKGKEKVQEGAMVDSRPLAKEQREERRVEKVEFDDDACQLAIFMRVNDVQLLRDLMGVVRLGDINQDNICVLNTALIFFIFAHRKGNLISFLRDLRAADNNTSSSSISMNNETRSALLHSPASASSFPLSSPPPPSDSFDPFRKPRPDSTASVLKNFRALLDFWREYYMRKRGRDCASLQYSTNIPFSEWLGVVELLSSDSDSPTSLLYVEPDPDSISQQTSSSSCLALPLEPPPRRC